MDVPSNIEVSLQETLTDTRDTALDSRFAIREPSLVLQLTPQRKHSRSSGNINYISIDAYALSSLIIFYAAALQYSRVR